MSDNNHVTFDVNEVLLKEGDAAGHAYLILSGSVNIVKDAMSDTPRTIATVSKGEVIGEMSLFDDHKHMASAIAAEKTVVSGISREQFQTRMDGMDPVMKGVMKLLVTRLRNMIDDMAIKETHVDWSNWRK